MKYRTLGRTGINVSEIGYGSWAIAGGLWKGAIEEESLRALHRAVDLGVNFIDTALVYGDGKSEELVGKFTRQRKEPLTIATKIPPKDGRWPARPGTPLEQAFPYEHIIECTEKSLRNLRADTIDLQQFHVWLDDWTDSQAWADAIGHLKEQGKIRFVGISVNDHQPESALKAARSGRIDSLQVIYNIFDQSPEDSLFPLCREMNLGIIVRVPFDEGALTGSIGPDTVFPEGDWRGWYFRGDRKAEVKLHIDDLKTTLGDEASSLPELALRFCLHRPEVSTVIPGMRTVEHADTNCTASDGRQLSQPFLATLQRHRWNKNYYR
jgi:aryl-alcohol dehydrogenase-like predicted oxidoreductase